MIVKSAISGCSEEYNCSLSGGGLYDVRVHWVSSLSYHHEKKEGAVNPSKIASERTDPDNSTEPQWTRIMKSQMPGVPGRGAGCFEDNGRWK